ncbi:Probable N-acetyltransferase HLS1-like [Striga hermonthica]|uniref:Probable N-acetyltransferase HLS1-like n=1 Tax=Striga hermonthica TaxID=68872 RepID=A0A9N7NJ81_STRHE|nr:Probable N-acetyltransferase HLS1-like [Striga hermonthica]
MVMDCGGAGVVAVAVVVREYNPKKDLEAVERMENSCEVGPSDQMALYTDLLGDPIARIRNSPAHLMLVAEMVVVGGGGKDWERREIVGTVRGSIKTVTCGTKFTRINANINNNNNNNKNNNNNNNNYKEALPVYAKLAYILGLRVSPSHRRMGIGLKLVRKMEEWFRDNGAEYSYMATENDNEASVNLFTKKCGYSKFRTPSILVQPVFAHRARADRRVSIIRLGSRDAETLYRQRFSCTEFFPRDIDAVLNNRLSLGTFLAVPEGSYGGAAEWPGAGGFLAAPPESWAVVSVWNCKEVYRLQVRGASRVRKGLARATRVLDRALPCLRVPSVPNVFGPFGFLFLYGLGGEGPDAVRMMRALCGVAHNLAREEGCEVVAAEVGREPLRLGIPHWKSLSCAEDLWCMKRLGEDYSDGSVGDWTKSPPGLSIFVDPREV